MRGQMTEVDTRIYYINKVNKIFIIINQCFEITSEDVIWAQSRWTTTLVDSINKLYFREERPFGLLVW